MIGDTFLKSNAIQALRPGSSFVYREETDTFRWSEKNSENAPTDIEIAEKRQELLDAYPMQLLRRARDTRLAETDWWAVRQAEGIDMTQEQKDYRTALRDLPSNSTPKIDDRLRLTNVTWPTKPE